MNEGISVHAYHYMVVVVCVCVWMEVWDLLVLPRRLAICNDWRELIQQKTESYYVPDRLALNTAFPSSPVAGWEETTADNKMTFFEITNFKNVPSIQLSTIHFHQQVALQIIYSSTW